MQTPVAMPTPTLIVPIRTDEHGKIRIGNTRVLLELVIHLFQQGETPESIQDSYDSLTLGEIYAVITYYLQNRQQVDAYMQRAEENIERILHEARANQTPEQAAFRARLSEYRDTKLKQELANAASVS